MIYSMTGYATLSEELALGTLGIEVRSVNHRYLDIQFRLPDELRSFEPGMRESIAARLSRGKVECRVSLAKSPTGNVALTLNTALPPKHATWFVGDKVITGAVPTVNVATAEFVVPQSPLMTTS